QPALVSGRREGGKAFEQALILGIKLARLIVRNHPNSADCLAVYVEGYEQTFHELRMNVDKLCVVAVSVGEQQRGVAIDHSATGAVVARRRCVPNQGRPLP